MLTVAPEWSRAEDHAGATHIWTGRRKGIALVVRLATILRRERVDIIQAYLLGSQVYALAAKALVRDVRLIAAVRASMGLDQIVGWNGKLSHALVFGLRSLVDQYVFNSSSGERTLGRRLSPDRRRVIFNGIDTTRFRPDAGAGAYLRGIAGLPAEGRLVGIVANVNPYKGYETFVRAADIIAGNLPDVHFVVVGDHDNSMGVRLRALVAELSLTRRFRFLGPRSDPERIVPGMDVVCSASISEGFSNSIAESMACGVPCVVTAVGDSGLIVGAAGLVVPPDDAAALAAGLSSLLSRGPDDRRALGAEARRRIEENFGIPRMVERHEALYDSLLGRARDGATRSPTDG